jgi:uncharacterized membrane protein
MEWYQYVAGFFAGVFLTNAVPHFVQGISGNKFPTPFAKPPGRGLSSSTVNVVWALFNMVIGYLLFSAAPIDHSHPLLLFTFFTGIAAISIISAINFPQRHQE